MISRRPCHRIVAAVALSIVSLIAFAAPESYPASELDKVLTLDEAARFLRIPKAKLESLARAKEVPGRQIAGEWRFSQIALVQWLNHDRPLNLVPAGKRDEPSLRLSDIGDASNAQERTEAAAPIPRTELAQLTGRQAQPGATPPPEQTPKPTETVGERRTAPTAEEVALRDQGVLLPGGRGTAEVDLLYSRAQRTIFLAAGGGIRVEQNSLRLNLGLRYGLRDNLQLSASLPGRYTRTAVFPGSFRDTEYSWGDPTLSLLGVGMTEGPWRPALIWNVQAVVPGGTSDAGFGGGVSMTKSLDPAIVFGGLSYLHGLRVDPDNAERSLANHNVGFNVGLAFALNDSLALTGQLIGSYRTHRAPTGGVAQPREQYEVQFGMTYVLTPKLYVEPTVAIGVGGTAPDFSIGLNVPYSF